MCHVVCHECAMCCAMCVPCAGAQYVYAFFITRADFQHFAPWRALSLYFSTRFGTGGDLVFQVHRNHKLSLVCFLACLLHQDRWFLNKAMDGRNKRNFYFSIFASQNIQARYQPQVCSDSTQRPHFKALRSKTKRKTFMETINATPFQKQR